MLSCGALERSSNPYIESTVEPCVSKNQKGIFAVWGVSLEENAEKALRQLKKYPLAESEICACVREKKKQFWNSCNHFKVYKKCKSPIQKGF